MATLARIASNAGPRSKATPWRAAGAGSADPAHRDDLLGLSRRRRRGPYLFNIPENLLAVVTLRRAGRNEQRHDAQGPLRGGVPRLGRPRCRQGIQQYGIVNDPKYGKLYAFECDGLGHTLLVDDAGMPGLLSIPYLDPSLARDPLVLADRKFSLSPDDPYFYVGTVAQGVGSKHTSPGTIWPMGLISQAITSTDNHEIASCLAMLNRSAAGSGYMHESFNKDDAVKHGWDWIAW